VEATVAAVVVIAEAAVVMAAAINVTRQPVETRALCLRDNDF
jgi:hypothetical protein